APERQDGRDERDDSAGVDPRLAPDDLHRVERRLRMIEGRIKPVEGVLQHVDPGLTRRPATRARARLRSRTRRGRRRWSPPPLRAASSRRTAYCALSTGTSPCGW